MSTPPTVVEGLDVDMRYFGDDNFVGARIDGYEAPRCILTRRAAAALALVQQDLAAQGLGLKVFDCYRPVRAVAHFVRWARDINDIKRKADFYPDMDKRASCSGSATFRIARAIPAARPSTSRSCGGRWGTRRSHRSARANWTWARASISSGRSPGRGAGR